MKNFFFFFLLVFTTSFLPAQQLLRDGTWRGVLQLNDTTELPFNFDLSFSGSKKNPSASLIIRNADENISVENLVITKDSVSWTMPVFDSYFRCSRSSDCLFSGTWVNNVSSKPYTLPFKAEYGKSHRFGERPMHAWGMKGKYETTFNPGSADEYKALGMFETKIKNGFVIVTGTFATETGDYRFLEGQSSGYKTQLSCFDGSHAFLFRINGIRDTMHGEFFSGKRGYEKFIIQRNENFELRDPEKLTSVIDSIHPAFTFSDLKGNPVSFSDSIYRNKVVLIQIMGSWCPNCMDETKWLSEIYPRYQKKGLEIIALAYERNTDSSKTNPNLRRLKDKYKISYTILNTGKVGKGQASESLPFLSGVMAFPTTIYIDKKGKVRKVYTGFNGPATGQRFEKDSSETLRFIEKLLSEN